MSHVESNANTRSIPPAPRKAFDKFRTILELGNGALLSVVALSAALYIAQRAPFQRIGAVISDEISRQLGVYSAGPFVLVRVDRAFSKSDLQTLLAHAIPALVDDYRSVAVGVDIDFSKSGYDQLSNEFQEWGRLNQSSAAKVVWAYGYQRGRGQPGDAPSEDSDTSPDVCANCDASCALRFRSKPIFENGYIPPEKGLAFVGTDASDINRYSFRFGCHQDTTAQLHTINSRLVRLYCDSIRDEHCDKLSPYAQRVIRLFSRYDPKTYDLCTLVACNGPALGIPPDNPPAVLENKVAILYSDVEGDDEHATIYGRRKGAEVVASLAMNELLYGESNQTLLEVFKWATEILFASVLVFLFHWPPTENWAVLASGVLFTGYILIAPRLSEWVPDFRIYVFAVMLGFAMEVWIKSAAMGYHDFRTKWRARVQSAKDAPEHA